MKETGSDSSFSLQPSKDTFPHTGVEKSKEAWLASHNDGMDRGDARGRPDGLDRLGPAVTPHALLGEPARRTRRQPIPHRCTGPPAHAGVGTCCVTGWTTSITSSTTGLSGFCAKPRPINPS